MGGQVESERASMTGFTFGRSSRMPSAAKSNSGTPDAGQDKSSFELEVASGASFFIPPSSMFASGQSKSSQPETSLPGPGTYYSNLGAPPTSLMNPGCSFASSRPASRARTNQVGPGEYAQFKGIGHQPDSSRATFPAPCFGSSTRYSRASQPGKSTPGPAQDSFVGRSPYVSSIGEQVHGRRRTYQRWSFSRNPRFQHMSGSDEYPGPGTYVV